MATTFDCPLCGKRMVTEGATTDVYLAVANRTTIVDVNCWSRGSGFCEAQEADPDPVQLNLFSLSGE